MRLLLVLLVLGLAFALPARRAPSGVSNGSVSLTKRLLSVKINPSSYPGEWDFTLASSSPVNSTWVLNTAGGGSLTIDWLHGCNHSDTAYPVFIYNGQVWNTLCQEGYSYQEVSDAFNQYYGYYGASVPTVYYAYYPHVLMSSSNASSNGDTTLIYVSPAGNHTIATTPTC